MKHIHHLITYIFSIIVIISLVAGCGIFKPNIPSPSTNTEVHVVDSIAWHDSTAIHHVYKEIYNDYTNLLDTLNMSNTYSDFSAWVDTNKNVLKGRIQNKDIDIPVQIKWKERIIYRDSIKIEEKPYPVEVEVVKTKHPFYESILWVLSALFVIPLIIKIVKRIYGF